MNSSVLYISTVYRHSVYVRGVEVLNNDDLIAHINMLLRGILRHTYNRIHLYRSSNDSRCRVKSCKLRSRISEYSHSDVLYVVR